MQLCAKRRQVPYSGKFSRAQIFMNHQQTHQEKNFAIFIFATRSRYPTTPPTIFLTQMVTLSMNLNVKTTVRRQHAYQNVSVAVSKELPCQREGANSEDVFAVAVMTGKLSQVAKNFRSLLDGWIVQYAGYYIIHTRSPEARYKTTRLTLLAVAGQ